jgi:carbon storage regulator
MIQGGKTMLVLSRRLGEEIVIGDRIVVKVLRLEKGRIRLGITASPAVSVDRREVQARRACPGAIDRE